MKLPRGADALVDNAKVRDYRLSTEHPVGLFKAWVFATAGYQRQDWPRARDDLKALVAEIEVMPGQADRFGQRFVGSGQLAGPNGTLLPVVTVWLVPSTDEVPRLVTAHRGRSARIGWANS